MSVHIEFVGRPAIVYWDGRVVRIWNDDTTMIADDLTPIERSVAVARFRKMADLIEATS